MDKGGTILEKNVKDIFLFRKMFKKAIYFKIIT